MAAPSSSDQPVTKSELNNLLTDKATDAIYSNWRITWGDDASVLQDEDVITVTIAEGNPTQHTIWSLVSIKEPDSEQPPFKLRSTSAASLPQEFLDKHLFKGLPEHLNAASHEIHVLISTLSGTGLSPSFFDNVLHYVLGAIGLKELDYKIIRTSSAESVAEFARSVLLPRAGEGKKQTVLMLSGDGGVVDTINGILDSEDRPSAYLRPTFCQFPLGTGNALFHSLHKSSPLPSIYIQAFRTLLHGTPRALPIFQAKFSPGARYLSDESRKATPLVKDTLYGAVVASYGLHATLVADSDTTEYRKHGDKRFGLVAKDLLSPPEGGPPHAYMAEVTLLTANGEVKIDRLEHGYILSSLVSNLEKTFTISPASKPLDGQLRVVHFGATSGESTMDIMKEAYNNGNHVGLSNVGYESVLGLKIQFLEPGEDWKWRRCCIDGLIVGIDEGGWMEVRTVETGSEAVDIVVDP